MASITKWNNSGAALLVFSSLWACGQGNGGMEKKKDMGSDVKLSEQDTSGLEQTVLGAGCFWCVEAVFQELEGVTKVESGYSNGHKKDPTYKEVCSGTTGYVEVARITYDPSMVSFDVLLEVFWQTHDPTTLNRQGNDVGDQYRSGIYYMSEAQRETAEHYKAELDKSGAWSAPIVTEIVALEDFYLAENYHQDYFTNNSEESYCRFVIQPKVEKFRKVFKDRLKTSE